MDGCSGPRVAGWPRRDERLRRWSPNAPPGRDGAPRCPPAARGGARMTTPPTRIVIELLSDTTFGRGEGTPGTVDVEIEHDTYGLPMLGGKSLRGLLRDTWLSMQEHFPDLSDAGRR